MRTLIVPAAGDGSRFRVAGYQDPKPFIRCAGVPMLTRAMAGFMDAVDDYLIIARDEHEEYYRDFCSPEHVVYQRHKQEGAALSILCAMGRVADDSEVVIINSDQFFPNAEEVSSWVRTASEDTRCSGSILTFHAEGGPWSYAELYPGSRIVKRVAEKQPISTVATCGAYYFRSWRQLRTAIMQMVVSNERYNNEFYLAPVYNQIIAHGGLVDAVDVTEFHSVGTPELLDKWLQATLPL